MTNPWTHYEGLPPFSAIDAEALGDAVAAAIASNREALGVALEAADAAGLVDLLDGCEERLHRAWSPLAHLHAVADSPAIRAAYDSALPAVAGYRAELEQDRGVFEALERTRGAAIPGSEDARVIDLLLRACRLAGVGLPTGRRARVRALSERLATEQAVFERNVLDATEGFVLVVEDPGELEGIPAAAVSGARRAAGRAGAGGWHFTLMLPSYLAVMMHAGSRTLRRRMYEAYVTRASDTGPRAGRWDNGEQMVRILGLRRELAAELGFPSWAEYSLATKMAGSAAQVSAFLRDLAARARPCAERELAELRAFARTELGLERLEAWDLPWCSERLRRQRFDLDDEQLRQYFPLPRVLAGLFELTRRLFGVQITEAEAATWHPDVRFFELRDADGTLRAMFYLDAYARAGKRGGAWMGDCLTRRRGRDGVQPPVAYLNCNAAEPEPGRPALLSHQDVTTLLHELGHGLHHMLTRVERGPISGINGVAWDAVELPSQLLENWAWRREGLALLSGHCETGEPLPAALFERLAASRRFQAGMQMLRQIELALFDMRLHEAPAPADSTAIQRLLDAVRAEVAVVEHPAYNRFQNAFTHVFAGGYGAGYYSYKWAEVLAADAFSAFESEGVLDAGVGRRFHDALLSRGGLRDARVLFRAFMGRGPRNAALLRQAGFEAA